MDEAACWQRLRQSSHGVLSTVHPKRGVDAVPVVFTIVSGRIATPVDRVKRKRATELQRVRNVVRDPRCALLVDHYEADWSRLWWVRAHAHARVLEGEDMTAAADALAERFEAYRAPGAIAAVLLLEPTRVRGWSAS